MLSSKPTFIPFRGDIRLHEISLEVPHDDLYKAHFRAPSGAFLTFRSKLFCAGDPPSSKNCTNGPSRANPTTQARMFLRPIKNVLNIRANVHVALPAPVSVF
jgi:hypothetical protein